MGQDNLLSMSQTIICRCVDIVSRIIDEKLDQYIRFPQTEAEMAINKTTFFDKFNFLGIIGVVDGTHTCTPAFCFSGRGNLLKFRFKKKLFWIKK